MRYAGFGYWVRLPFVFAALAIPLTAQSRVEPDHAYLQWDAKRAKQIALSTRINGQAGKSLDFRVIHTERSFNFKLRATWFTPEVIRARARLVQLSERLSDNETRQIVDEAGQAGGVIVLVEIDPREGSGIIPAGWTAFLQPKDSAEKEQTGIRGISNPELGEMKALAGVVPRDYAYDQFWMKFDTPERGVVSSSSDPPDIELVVQIHNKIGKVRWKTSDLVKFR